MDRGYGSSAEVLRSIREFELAQDSQQMQDILQDCSHYWVTAQSELSTDILFRSRQGLSELYPELLSHGTLCFGAKEVMTFLGRKLRGNFEGEIVSDLSDFAGRMPGCRIKHRVKE